jgi:phage-related protein
LPDYNNIDIICLAVWNIEYYGDGKEKYPVLEFIESLDVKAKAKIARTLDLLEEFGIKLGMPYAKHIEEQLWELRIRQANNRYRIIYFLFDSRNFVLLHGLTKKSSSLSKKDIEIAKNRRQDYLSRRQSK